MARGARARTGQGHDPVQRCRRLRQQPGGRSDQGERHKCALACSAHGVGEKTEQEREGSGARTGASVSLHRRGFGRPGQPAPASSSLTHICAASLFTQALGALRRVGGAASEWGCPPSRFGCCRQHTPAARLTPAVRALVRTSQRLGEGRSSVAFGGGAAKKRAKVEVLRMQGREMSKTRHEAGPLSSPVAKPQTCPGKALTGSPGIMKAFGSVGGVTAGEAAAPYGDMNPGLAPGESMRVRLLQRVSQHVSQHVLQRVLQRASQRASQRLESSM